MIILIELGRECMKSGNPKASFRRTSAKDRMTSKAWLPPKQSSLGKHGVSLESASVLRSHFHHLDPPQSSAVAEGEPFCATGAYPGGLSVHCGWEAVTM